MEGPVAVLLPGAGSSADFVRRAFARPLTEAGCELVAVSPVPGPGVVEAGYAALDAAARAYGPRLTLVGGISLGAHIAARWAAATAAAPGLLLALPAWSGAPGPVAAATAAAADRVARLGMSDAVRAAGAGPVRWVAAEVAAAWPAYGAELVATFRAAAAAPGPSAAELRSVTAAAGVVGIADDPLHPAAVAEEWASLLPRGGLARLRLADLAGDRSVLGSASLRALKAALAAR